MKPTEFKSNSLLNLIILFMIAEFLTLILFTRCFGLMYTNSNNTMCELGSGGAPLVSSIFYLT